MQSKRISVLISRLIYGERSECRRGNHKWTYWCICQICGETRHDYQVVKVAYEEPRGCCWAAEYPCIGPHCGVPCENYTPGQEGKTIRTWECTRCGHRKEEEVFETGRRNVYNQWVYNQWRD